MREMKEKKSVKRKRKIKNVSVNDTVQSLEQMEVKLHKWDSWVTGVFEKMRIIKYLHQLKILLSSTIAMIVIKNITCVL